MNESFARFQRGRAAGRRFAREWGDLDELDEVCEEQESLKHDREAVFTRGFVYGYRETLEQLRDEELQDDREREREFFEACDRPETL
jgi:hypothetical protein